MKTKLLIVALALALTLSLGVAGVGLADSTIGLPRSVLGGGASNSTAAGVGLRATLGQPVVGIVSSGDVTLGQGFWGTAGPYKVYLPLVLRGL